MTNKFEKVPEELQPKPCPFCGFQPSTVIRQTDDDFKAPAVWCARCGAQGPQVIQRPISTIEEAVAAWNDRGGNWGCE